MPDIQGRVPAIDDFFMYVLVPFALAALITGVLILHFGSNNEPLKDDFMLEKFFLHIEP